MCIGRNLKIKNHEISSHLEPIPASNIWHVCVHSLWSTERGWGPVKVARKLVKRGHTEPAELINACNVNQLMTRNQPLFSLRPFRVQSQPLFNQRNSIVDLIVKLDRNILETVMHDHIVGLCHKADL